MSNLNFGLKLVNEIITKLLNFLKGLNKIHLNQKYNEKMSDAKYQIKNVKPGVPDIMTLHEGLDFGD